MEESGKIHATAVLLPGKELPLPVEKKAGSGGGGPSRAGLDNVTKGKVSLHFCREMNQNPLAF